MADETKSKSELDRTEIAGRLSDLSEQFSEEGGIAVEVENKTITLHPPTNVDYEISVREREPMVGDKTETVALTLSWTPEE
jgi:amphi-Trp domain-containing protein